jgi:hypothetical protein
MDRRHFLIACGGLGVIGVGGRLGHQALARERLRRELVEAALPALIDKHNRESHLLPGEKRDEIRRWFHGKCLNSASFAREICGRRTRQVLGSLRDEGTRFEYLYERFCSRVVSHAGIINRIETLQAESGDIIDANWSACCSEISARWGRQVRRHRPPLGLGDLSVRLDPVIREGLAAALRGLRSAGAGGDPARKLLDSLGRTAMMMLAPTTRLPQVAIPTFLFLALSHVFDFIFEMASDPVAGYQAELSARVAHLGNRIGDEFETAIRGQLAEIHLLQDSAVTGQAAACAEAMVPTLI